MDTGARERKINRKKIKKEEGEGGERVGERERAHLNKDDYKEQGSSRCSFQARRVRFGDTQVSGNSRHQS